MAQTKDKKGSANAPAEVSAEQRTARLRLAMRVWVVLMGVMWAGTVAYAPSAFGWLPTESINIIEDVQEKMSLKEGNVPSPLKHPDVEPGSVRVFDEAGETPFVEGVDYTISLEGDPDRSSVTRLPKGKIPEDAFVKIRYKTRKQIPVPGLMGLAIGGFLGVAIIVGCLKKFSSRFDYLKPEQARMVRMTAFAVLAALSAFGCATLYVLPSDGSLWWSALGSQAVYGQEFTIRPMIFPSLAVFLTLMFVVYLLINRALWTDFLIETEGEMKKVSWPKRQEYIGSSAVVVVVVVVVSMFLFVSDWVLSAMMKKTGIGF